MLINIFTRKIRLFYGGASTINVPAGHRPNLEAVTEHYRKQHYDEEERKVRRLAELEKNSESS